MTTTWATTFSQACADLSTSAGITARSFRELAKVVNEHRQEWLCALPGQWPDQFALLNRYVRANVEPPYIFND